MIFPSPSLQFSIFLQICPLTRYKIIVLYIACCNKVANRMIRKWMISHLFILVSGLPLAVFRACSWLCSGIYPMRLWGLSGVPGMECASVMCKSNIFPHCIISLPQDNSLWERYHQSSNILPLLLFCGLEEAASEVPQKLAGQVWYCPEMREVSGWMSTLYSHFTFHTFPVMNSFIFYLCYSHTLSPSLFCVS